MVDPINIVRYTIDIQPTDKAKEYIVYLFEKKSQKKISTNDINIPVAI